VEALAIRNSSSRAKEEGPPTADACKEELDYEASLE
jgi:hypothetical protein